MAALNKFDDLNRAVLAGVHQFGTHVFKVVFTNTAPVAANTQLSNITQIASSGNYTAGVGGGLTLDGVSVVATGASAKVLVTDEVFTATAAVGPFRYVVLYNDTAANDPLIGWYDYGSSITLNTDESLTLDFDAVNGVLTLG